MDRTKKLMAGQIVVFLLVAAFSMPVEADEMVIEPSSGRSFPATRDGLNLLGVAVRKKFVINVYALALYVDTKGFAAKVGAEVDKEEASRAVLSGAFKKRLDILFVLNAPVGKVRSAFRKAIALNMSEEDMEAEKESIEAFLASFRTVKRGEIFTMVSVGKTTTIYMGSERMFKTSNPKLSYAMWAGYISGTNISETLRTNLLVRAPDMVTETR